jgi:hypothetical protein
MLLGMSRAPESVVPAELSQVPWENLIEMAQVECTLRDSPSSQRMRRFPGREEGYCSDADGFMGMCTSSAAGLDIGQRDASESTTETPSHCRIVIF